MSSFKRTDRSHSNPTPEIKRRGASAFRATDVAKVTSIITRLGLRATFRFDGFEVVIDGSGEHPATEQNEWDSVL